jgi:hypothetical protein
MKNEKQFYEQCLLILGREIEVLKKIGALQNIIQKAVASRGWMDFEAHNQALNGLGFEFEALEAERVGLLAEKSAAGGGGDEKRHFYALISCFSPELRDELARTYRALKFEALRVRMVNEALAAYLAGAKNTMTGFLEAAFPERAGRLYTHQGTQSAPDMRSVVLNRHF